MSITVATVLAVLATELVCIAVQFFCDLWGNRVNAPSTLCTEEMSEVDKKMQQQTKNIIHDVFGENVAESVQNMKAAQRIEKVEELVKQLKEEYRLDVEVEFYGENRNECGFYNGKQNTLSLNVADLLSNNSEQIQVFFDTVIHELRHAVQWKAVQEEGFWNIGRERRIKWADNFKNYISINVDPKGYARQPVEMDACTFSAGCMEGVF